MLEHVQSHSATTSWVGLVLIWMFLCISCLLLFDTVRSIKLRNCNFDYQSPEHLFDPSEPGGSYVCNLADPYERVVGNELVRPYSRRT